MDNVKNIIMSLNYIAYFINKRDIKNNSNVNLSYLKGFGQVVQSLLSAVYKSGWNKLKINNKNYSFRQNVLSQFNKNKGINPNMSSNKLRNNSKTKLVKFSNLLTCIGLLLLVPS